MIFPKSYTEFTKDRKEVYHMKRKSIGLIVATLVVVSIGSRSLWLSVTQVKGAVKKELSGNTEIGMESVGTDVIGEDSSIVYFDGASSNDISSNNPSDVTLVSGVYQGQAISVIDGLTDKENAWENATEIMDYIYDYVDKNIFAPCEIDKSEYKYSIQRQYHEQNGVNYGVFLLKGEKIICTIGICLEEEPVLTSFARDGLVDLYGGVRKIPTEYLVENWCKTSEQRERIYGEYLVFSKEIIEDMLGLPSINEAKKDINCITYFEADDSWSTVTFGYVLEDGLYVKVFYNRVNQMWDGFEISGYNKNF